MTVARGVVAGASVAPRERVDVIDAGRRDWPFTLAVAFVALLPRLFVAIAWAREPVWDGHYYHFGALRIAEGLGYSEDITVNGATIWKPWSHYPVGYSAFLALAYSAFGKALWVAPLFNALTGTALVAVAHRFARYFVSETRARVGAALVALHPGLIAYAAVLMTEPLAALLVLGAALACVRRRDKLGSLVAAGALVGLATLVRPSSLLAGPLLALLFRFPSVRGFQRAGIATAVALAVVTPWTIRNCRVMDGCALVSTNGGWNLAIGALTDTGRFVTLRASDGCKVVTGQVQQDRCWASVGARTIADDPAAWLALVPKKLAQTYNHESFAIEYFHEADPSRWPDARRIAGRQLLTFAHDLLLIAAALSIIGRPTGRMPMKSQIAQGTLLAAVAALALYAAVSDENAFWPLAALLPIVALLPFPGRSRQGPAGRYLLGLVFATSLTHAVFFGDDRYHLVITPALCLLAAGALRPAFRAAPTPSIPPARGSKRPTPA